MSPRSLAALLVLAVAVSGCVAPAIAPGEPGPGPAAAASPAESQVRHEVVESFDGTAIAITVFRPPNASSDSPVPVVVRSHGWSGKRDQALDGLVRDLVVNGYGVVTVDMRGHGESGGLARVHDPDYEIRDVGAVFDWIHDNLDWVAKQTGTGHEKDVLAGGSGGSYGGGWQLLFAAHDGRLDALAPEITWNSLPQALAPNGVANSVWLAFLYSGGTLRARMDPMIDEWFVDAMATNEFPPEAYAHFENSSVYPVIDRIRAPALLLQGSPDTLFNLDQAVANWAGIRANGVEARLFGHLDGHLANPALLNGNVPDVGLLQPGTGVSACGDVHEEIVKWFDRHLKGLDVPAGPAVAMGLDDGETCVTGDDLDSLVTPREVALDAPIALGPDVGSVVVHLLDVPAEGLRLVGAPRLDADVTSAGPGDIAFFSLVAVGTDHRPRTLSAQVTPLRFDEALVTGDLSLPLHSVASLLEPGEQLFLKVDRQNEFFATNGGRAPALLALTDVVVTVPSVEG